MMTLRKRWWRAAVVAAVGGGVIAGGWFGFVRATPKPAMEDAAVAKPPETPAPMVAEVGRGSAEPPAVTAVEPQVILASGTLPIPLPTESAPVKPVAPATPTLTLPPPPSLVVPVSPVDPVAVPRLPDVVPVENKTMPPALPPLPLSEPPQPKPTSAKEPKKAPPTLPNAEMSLPAPVIPQPAEVAPLPLPSKPADPPRAAPPSDPDSRLISPKPGHTLNPSASAAPAPLLLPAPTPVTSPEVAPAVPVVPPGGRETPGATVERPKPPEPLFGSTEKFEFSLPGAPDPRVATPRDNAMLNLKHTAALAVLGGALFTAEQSKSFAVAPIPPVTLPNAPAVPTAADEKTDLEKVKKDLDEANKKISELEKQVKRLTELLTGRKDDIGAVPTEPGAVEEIKRLKDRIATLEKELKSTSLRPAVSPDAKPKGIVKVVNEYPVEISIVVNDKSYRVAPNTKLDVEVPAGEFSYQLLQSGAGVTRSAIKDKETVTLRIK